MKLCDVCAEDGCDPLNVETTKCLGWKCECPCSAATKDDVVVTEDVFRKLFPSSVVRVSRG